MSIIKPRNRNVQQFFRSGPLPCPYLPDRVERKLFTRVAGPDAAALNSQLTRAGFRRSHDIIYRPVCDTCSACVPVRIPVAVFRPNRTMRRLLRTHDDLVITARSPEPTLEQFELFQHYQGSRHSDSDMARMTASDYAAMMEEGAFAALVFEARSPDGRLLAVMLADKLSDGLSAVYCFYDTDGQRRSLGTIMILKLVEAVRHQGLDHVYLGYWVQNSPRMDYKRKFQPIERMVGGRWVPEPARQTVCDPSGSTKSTAQPSWPRVPEED